MKIVIIGTGNVATVLAGQFTKAGHVIPQVYGRNAAAASVLANRVGAAPCSSLKEITQEAALYLVCVADKAIQSIAAELPLNHQLVVHTAGSVSIEALKNVSANYGVFYPFQTIRKEVTAIPAMPIMIDGNTVSAKETLLQLANTISGKVSIANDLQRMQYHLCAVMTNNFSNYLVVLAENYCRRHGLDFSNLLPLLDETTRRLHEFSPAGVQTGPAIRKDMGTIDRHLALLDDEPGLKKIYQLFSQEIAEYNW